MNKVQLAQNITYMLQNGDYVAGHAIFNRENIIDNNLPNKILKEGLIVQDASCGLSFTTRYFRLPYEECIYNLNFFIEDTSNAVIIISIPKELLSDYEPKYFKSCNNTSILLELTNEISNDYKDIYGNPTNIALLPSAFILGYLDVQKDTFIETPSYAFNDNIRNINISKLKPILDKKYEKILEESKYNLSKKL